MKLVIAEKPAVARDIANAVGATQKAEGHFLGPDYAVSWCVGHLFELLKPEDYDPTLKKWRLESLPIVPSQLRYQVRPEAEGQWQHVRRLLRCNDFETVVNACDAGREGELIFRVAYQEADCWLPVQRLWITSLTSDAIRRGLERLVSGERFESLGAAARCRAEADWLVGINATRAMTLLHGGPDLPVASVGRVQTPTLALLVERENERRMFQAERYLQCQANIVTETGESAQATWIAPEGQIRLAPPCARPLQERLEPHQSLHVLHVRRRSIVEPPPGLFDLSTLMQVANAQLGLTAVQTTDLAQTLYERHKLITYPRTDSRALGPDEGARLPAILDRLGADDALQDIGVPAGLDRDAIGRVVDAAAVTDHHAIIPTGQHAPKMRPDAQALYHLILRRFFEAIAAPAQFEETQVLLGTDVQPVVRPKAKNQILQTLPPGPDVFRYTGRRHVVAGWRGAQAGLVDPPNFEVGSVVQARLAFNEDHTQAPKRLTDASLLAAMERVGAQKRGLGTAATRARIIETLVKRGYVLRKEGVFMPQVAAIHLLEALSVETLKSPEMTAEWEAKLELVAHEAMPQGVFMGEVESFVRRLVETMTVVDQPQDLVCPRCGGAGLEASAFAWGCADWRSGCGFTVPFEIAGHALTGAQLAELVRQGYTRPFSTGRGRARFELKRCVRLVRLETAQDHARS